jgi:hypothetical protein
MHTISLRIIAQNAEGYYASPATTPEERAEEDRNEITKRIPGDW